MHLMTTFFTHPQKPLRSPLPALVCLRTNKNSRFFLAMNLLRGCLIKFPACILRKSSQQRSSHLFFLLFYLVSLNCFGFRPVPSVPSVPRVSSDPSITKKRAPLSPKAPLAPKVRYARNAPKARFAPKVKRPSLVKRPKPVRLAPLVRRVPTVQRAPLVRVPPRRLF